MTADNQESETGNSQPESQENPTLPEEPTLNRAERRAAAKGKKAPTSGNTFGGQSQQGGGKGFGGGNIGKSRLPRTGHK